VLLVIALLALIVGTIFLYIESTNVGGRGTGAARPAAGPAMASAPVLACASAAADTQEDRHSCLS
jgi:hypothetical protein